MPFFGLLCHYPPAVILCELPALDFLERDVIMVHLSFGGDPVGQRRTGRLGGELQLLCVKPAVVQPSLVCFRNLNWIAMIVNVVHFITSLLSCSDGWCIRLYLQQYPDSGSKAITKALKERGKESHYLTIRIL